MQPSWHDHVPYALEILDGDHGGMELYRVKAAGQQYLLKILPGEFSQQRLDRISEICKLYQSLGIRSLNLIKFGKVKVGNQAFCFYDHVEGDNYEAASELATTEDNYAVGKQVGAWLGKLKNTVPPLKLANREDNLDTLVQEILTAYYQVFTNPAVVRMMGEYFELSTLVGFGDELLLRSKLFLDCQKHLIHGDIKRSNIMIDGKGEIWLVDIESLKMSYDIMNFRYQICRFLSMQNPKELAFLRGVLDGLYKNTRPIDFRQQLVYITLLNFCEYITHHAYETAELRGYLERMRPVFNKIARNELMI